MRALSGALLSLVLCLVLVGACTRQGVSYYMEIRDEALVQQIRGFINKVRAQTHRQDFMVQIVLTRNDCSGTEFFLYSALPKLSTLYGNFIDGYTVIDGKFILWYSGMGALRQPDQTAYILAIKKDFPVDQLKDDWDDRLQTSTENTTYDPVVLGLRIKDSAEVFIPGSDQVRYFPGLPCPTKQVEIKSPKKPGK